MNDREQPEKPSVPLRTRFLDAMSRMASSVCVVTTDGPAGCAGMTVSSMTPVSAEGLRPSLCVCLHHDAPARSAIQANGVFCVNLLGTEQSDVADVFAGRTGVSEDARFTGVDWTSTAAGARRIVGCLVALDCKLEHSYRHDTHHIMVGSVIGIEVEGAGPVLIYTDRAYGVPGPLNSGSLDTGALNPDKKDG
ncbi:MAG: flavin reductase family protein [Gammaproteobacteria bacterium]